MNTASKCSFTVQYQGLEDIYRRLQEQYNEDFVILGFPCNQFLRQEPGSNNDIQSFCQLNYGVTFPVLAKVNVNGGQAAAHLSMAEAAEESITGMSENYMEFYEGIGPNSLHVGRTGILTKRSVCH